MDPNENKINKFFRILAVFAVAAILSVTFYYIKTVEYKNWQPADGVLINMEQGYSSGRHGHGSRWYRLYYTYTVDGKSYSGVDTFSGNLPKDHFIGEEVEVWYNPADRSKSMYAKPGPGLWPYVPFIFALPISLSVFAYRKDTGLRNV